MGDINTNIRIDELITKYDEQIKALKSDISKLKTQNLEGIEITVQTTGTLSDADFNKIKSAFDHNRNFHVMVRYNEMGFYNYYYCNTFQKYWINDPGEYVYILICDDFSLYISMDKTYEVLT